MNTKYTHIDKILMILIEEYKQDPKKYLSTFEFMQRASHFIGHRAPARISELSLDYPDMIETDKTEKVYKYRFKGENVNQFYGKLPKKFKDIIRGFRIPVHEHVQNPDSVQIRIVDGRPVAFMQKKKI